MGPDPGAVVFLAEVGPIVGRGRVADALAALNGRWNPQRLTELLASQDTRAAALAARCLGMTGDMESCPDLVRLLARPDREITPAAEDALWSLWMRASSETATQALTAAMRLIDEGNCGAALELLHDLIEVEPQFAEAHHQAALAHHSLSDFPAAEQEYRETVRLNPFHYAALAGLGHLAVERGDLSSALQFYRRAVQIHPRLEGVSELLPALEAARPKSGVEYRV